MKELIYEFDKSKDIICILRDKLNDIFIIESEKDETEYIRLKIYSSSNNNFNSLTINTAINIFHGKYNLEKEISLIISKMFERSNISKEYITQSIQKYVDYRLDILRENPNKSKFILKCFDYISLLSYPYYRSCLNESLQLSNKLSDVSFGKYKLSGSDKDKIIEILKWTKDNKDITNNIIDDITLNNIIDTMSILYV